MVPRLRVPPRITALLFDLDGVLTQTAKVHAAAWQQMFDSFLRERAVRTGGEFRPFRLPHDYREYVDGKLRADGVRSFLRSRGIELPEGAPEDPPDVESIHGLGSRKNDLFLDLLAERGVEVYEGSVRFLEVARVEGHPTAVVTASANGEEILRAAGLTRSFDVRIDGLVARAQQLRGKPAPDMFLAAAGVLDVAPARCAVLEDAEAGVEAGRAGGFGWVVGVDRTDNSHGLWEHGADVVVKDLEELLEER
jgi:beta-phosphoglucomutase family hydrolase